MQTFFTNWRYHKQYQTSPSAYAQRDCGDNSRKNQAQVKKKRCFVCNKKVCWSSKHTRKKRETLKNKFKEQFFQGFDKQISQYIAEHEEVDHESDDNTDSIDDAAEAFMIDFKFLSPSPLDKENSNTDTFITSFETIHSVKIITINFANCFFEHILTTSNQDSEYHKSDPFIYITSERYTSDEFYEIMIETKTSKQSTCKTVNLVL